MSADRSEKESQEPGSTRINPIQDRSAFKSAARHSAVIAIAVAILIASLAAQFFLERHPMSDVHWDAPIYLIQAKKFSEGGYVDSIRTRSSQIKDSLTAKAQNNDWWDYWPFARLGHIALAGNIVGLTGTDETAIARLTWAYRLVLATGLAFAVVMTLTLVANSRTTGDRSAIPLAALISLALYLLSDAARYMSGNLVAEVPGIVLLTCAGWVLIRAFGQRSHLLAAASGFLAFLLYFVAMDSVWSYMSLLVLIAWYFSGANETEPLRPWWRGILTVILAGGIPFVVYSMVFFPLTDPRLMLHFANAAIGQHVKQPLAFGAVLHGIVRQPTVAIGFLFVGTLLALPMLVKSRLARFGFAWLALAALLPSSIAVVSGSVAEVRKYTLCIPAAFLLSTLGWAGFIARTRRSLLVPSLTRDEIGSPNAGALPTSKPWGSRVAIGAVTLVLMGLMLISFPSTYEWLRAQPGLWRLKEVRAWLTVPRYERVDYHVPELAQIYQVLRSKNADLVLVASPGMQGKDYQHVIAFLSSDPIQRKGGHPGSDGGGARGIRVVEVKDENDLNGLLTDQPMGTRLFLLKAPHEVWASSATNCCGNHRLVLATEHFQVEELVGERTAD